MMPHQLPARLTDPWFEATFYSHVVDGSFWLRHEGELPVVFTYAEAQGLFLWCPCGYGALDKDGALKYPLDLSLNHGRPHGLLVPFADRGLPESHGPVNNAGGHPRWAVSGSSLEDLTTSPSIAVGDAPNCWHGFITNGLIT